MSLPATKISARRFEPRLIHGGKPGPYRTVEIQHADHLAFTNQRHDEFGAGRGIAGDMPGKIMDVRNPQRSALPHRRAADALPDRDPHTGGLSLERSQHQRIALEEIKAGPVEVGKRGKDQGRAIGGIGDHVAFARQQAGQLPGQLVIRHVVAGRRSPASSACLTELLPSTMPSANDRTGNAIAGAADRLGAVIVGICVDHQCRTIRIHQGGTHSVAAAERNQGGI